MPKSLGVTFLLLLANIVVFFLQIVVGGSLTSLFQLTPAAFIEPWRFLTHMFIHFSPNHLLFNMLGLFFFGPLLESRLGYKRFLLVYFGSGLLAGLLGALVYTAAGGASAALMGIVGATIIFFPRIKVLLFFVVPMPLWVAGIGFFLLDFFGLFFPGSTANFAHLVGLLAGLAFGMYFKNYMPKVKVRRNKGEKEETIEVYDPSEYRKKFG